MGTLTACNPCGKVAGVAGLEPVTSAVTGQRSNQLSYTPAMGRPLYWTVELSQRFSRTLERKVIRAAHAKEVGVGNPAEETYRSPNHPDNILLPPGVNPLEGTPFSKSPQTMVQRLDLPTACAWILLR